MLSPVTDRTDPPRMEANLQRTLVVQVGPSPRPISSGNRQQRTKVHRHHLDHRYANHGMETILRSVVETQRYHPREHSRYSTSSSTLKNHPRDTPMVLPARSTASHRPHRHSRSEIRSYHRNGRYPDRKRPSPRFIELASNV